MLARQLARDPVARKAFRDACRRPDWIGFYTFAQAFFLDQKGFRWVHNWHHAAIAKQLGKVYSGESTRVIFNLPPRYGKTELIVKMFIAWAFGMNPDSEWIHASYASALAVDNSAAIRAIVTSDLFRIVFPEFVLDGASTAKDHWKTSVGGVMFATGTGGTCTGFGAGKPRPGFGGAIVLDDPHKAAEATSDKKRGAVLSWFENTLESRKNDPKRTPIILVMQRLHETDLAGFLLGGRAPDEPPRPGGNGETWELLCLDAIQPGDVALWPAKHSIEELQRMARANPYVFAGQYRQRPAPGEGGEFKPDAMTFIDAIPLGTRFVRAWDFAGTDGGGDYTAGGLLGIAPSGRYVIAGMERDQLAPDGVEELVKTTAELDGKGIVVAFPQDPGQAGKAQARAFVRLLCGWMTSTKPVSGDKVVRARPLAAQVNVGNVDIVRGPWNKALIDEMRTFPKGANDDQIDALSLAFDELTSGETSLLDFYRQQAEEEAKLRAASEKARTPEIGPAAFAAAIRA